MDSLTIIGSSDGPTSIFLAGNIEVGWLNIFGLLIVIGIMIPNIIYAIKFKDEKNNCKSRVMNIVEQIGRYASMFLMIFNIGIAEFGIPSIRFFMIYLVGNIVLVAAYWVVWILYFMKRDLKKSMALAIIPTLIFLLNGITMRHYFLLLSAVIFGIGHLYVTYQNSISLEQK